MRKWRQRSGGGNTRDLLREAAKHGMQDSVSKAAHLIMTASVPRASGRDKKSAVTNMGVGNADRDIHLHTQRSCRETDIHHLFWR